MADFEKAWAFMGPHEWNHQRNFTNIPADPGGATMWGITLRSLMEEGTLYDLDGNGVVDVSDLKMLSEDQAKAYYLQKYWQRPHMDLIVSDRIAAKVFDMGVNLGPARAIMYLQEVVNAFGNPTLVDGRLGPVTAGRVAALDEQRVLDGLVRALVDHYDLWVAHDPVDREQFHAGLLDRARSLP